MVDTDNFESFLEEMLENEDLSSAQKTAQAVEVKPESQPETQSELQPAAKEKKSEITKRNPFKFLDAYTPDDLDIFFGRDMEIAELYHTAFSHKVSVVFGNSGAGKTSLVQCGFLSRVKPEKAAFFPIRSAIDPLSSLKTECISKICIYDDESDLFTNLTLAAQTLKKTMILFFDQFEEIFILQPLETRRQLAILLKKIIHSDLDIKIIMGIREEYFARLIEFEKVIPDILSNRIWVRNMSGMQAEKVIVNPCQVCGVEIEPDVPKQVIAELSQGKEGVELPYVQVVMDNLFGRAVERDPDHPHIRSADFTIQGGVKNILSNFIEDQIKDMSDVEKTKQVLKSLITSEGTKRILNIGGIADASSNYGEAIELAMLQEILRELVTRRILREDPDNALYELRHDTLAFTILKWMSGIEQELMEVRQTLENRFREYQARNTLLDASALGYIAPYESRLRLKPEMLDFIEKSKKEAAKKRRRILTAVGVAVAVFVLAVSVLGGFGYLKSIEATNQSIEANKQAKEAITQKAFAEAKLIEARHNMGLVYNEKAERAIENKNFNAGRLYALHALNSFDLELAGEEKSKAIGMVLSHPDYPIIFSTPDGSHHDGAGMSVSFSPDGKTLASGFWDKTIRLWDVETGKEKSLLSGHTDRVWSVSFSPDGKTLASGYWNNPIRLWDVETGKEKFQLSGHTNTVNSVSFSPDGKTLASGSGDKTIRLWNVKTGKEKFQLSGHTNTVDSVSFSPDGKTLASGSGDNTICLWDVQTGKEKSQLPGHTAYVNSVSFSPDGKTLASGSGDKTIRLWDVETGKEKSLLPGHTSYVNSVSFSPDGKTLASGSDDNTIRLWDLTFYFKVKDRQVNEAEIKKAEQQYNLHLVKLEMQPILEERNLYRIKPQLPDWPQTHPFHWLAKAEAGDSDAMLELGFIYDRDNNMDKAEYWYRRSAKSGHREVEERLKRLEISKAEVFYNSGVEFHNSGQFDKAIENYTQAIALNSEHADAYWNRSNIYGNQKKYDLAIPDLRKINLLASDFADAYGQLGWFLIMQGKYEEAKAPCLKAHELAPDSYACAVNVGHTYLLTGDAGKAREYYGKTIDLIKTEEEFTKGPMADFELFISNGWQVEACRQEMAWMKKAFKAAGSETHSHIDIN